MTNNKFYKACGKATTARLRNPPLSNILLKLKDYLHMSKHEIFAFIRYRRILYLETWVYCFAEILEKDFLTN